MTPEQEEQVRLALAAAARAERGHTPPMPPEVVDRLDRVLAELVAGRAARSAPAAIDTDGPVVPDELAARRKRNWPHVLVAAAAVAVIAAAGGAVVTRGFGGGEGQTSTEAASEPQLRDSTLRADIQRLATGGTAESPATPVPSANASERQRPDGSPSGGTSSNTPGFGASQPSPTLGPATGHAAPGCQDPIPPPGARVIPVRLDGKQATLVLDAPLNGIREARVYSCDDGSYALRTVRVQQR